MEERNRIRNAIDLLKEGKSTKIGDIKLGIYGNDNIYITGWSKYKDLESLTKKQALQELNDIRNIFESLLQSSDELEEYVSNKRIKYNLAYSYGRSGIIICSELNGEIKWKVDLEN